MSKRRFFLQYLFLCFLAFVIGTTYIWLGTIHIFLQEGVAAIPEIYVYARNRVVYVGESFSFFATMFVLFLPGIQPRQQKIPLYIFLLYAIFYFITVPPLSNYPHELTYAFIFSYQSWMMGLYFLYGLIWVFLLYLTCSEKILWVSTPAQFYLFLLLGLGATFLVILYKDTNLQFPANLINFLFGVG